MTQDSANNNLTDALGPLGDLLATARQRLSEATVEASAGGGAVRVTMDGERKLRAIHISDDAMHSQAWELEELILAATREAWEKAAAARNDAIDSIVPGFGLR